ncbi:DUF4269 domain-containing protein [Paenibacillus agilis]|uniref:DUF4269 domain-containing protein n=1 Tax=Paenibacillus agilis TaxID=3020863 RepID=A0A559J3I4_9BACL|nr:DUF4269 domain-containing protein [Paenibacillus agilis]TVX94376.1 DUF4269 domain-containing protein [Paenibacillus agilis]
MADLNQCDFIHFDYLLQGNETQHEAYSVLHRLNIMELLRPYNPILVGTIPIDIHISNSDLDIICEVHDLDAFVEYITASFQCEEQYRYTVYSNLVNPYAVVNFRFQSWEIEIFAQPIPTTRQNGYRHMLVEHRILQLLGSGGYHAIRHLKETGYKTEPAFAKLLQLEGDPYERLLELAEWDEEALSQFIMQYRSFN